MATVGGRSRGAKDCAENRESSVDKFKFGEIKCRCLKIGWKVLLLGGFTKSNRANCG